MCEQTEINYLDGDVVWVKLGACWWPGQVTGFHNLPEDIQTEFQKKPLIAVVKFFQEDTYEFVKNYQQIYKYNCTQKDEFIRKGLDKYRSKSKDGSSYMDKFPGDVEMAEKLTGGDPDILSQEKFCPEEKPDISALFGDKKVTKKKKDRDDMHRRSDSMDVVRKITHPRFLKESDHEVRIRQQPRSLPSTPNNTGSPQYPCHLCSFTSSRVNVIICHIKSHRSGNSPTARSKVKSISQHRSRVSDSDTPKRKYARKEKTTPKSRNESHAESGKRKQPKQIEKANKKKKTDPKIRDTILADWEDESDEDISMNTSKLADTSTLSTLSTRTDSDTEIQDELDKKNNSIPDGSEIIAETEKLLKETEKLTSIHSMDSLADNVSVPKPLKSNQSDESIDMDDDSKISDSTAEKATVKTQKGKESSSSDTDTKYTSSDKGDKKSLLSCFDFHEEELSIPPVRKKGRAFHQKKEIIKEFEMSQALKNEQEREAENKKLTELEQNKKAKTSDVPEEIKSSTNNQDSNEVEKSTSNMEETVKSDIDNKTAKSKAETVTPSSENSQKSTTQSCETELEIVEIFEVEREEPEEESSRNTEESAKDKVKDDIASDVQLANNKMAIVENNEPHMESKSISDDKQLLHKDTTVEGAIIEAMEQASTKETEETLSERFTTETEDETVSESAETLPEQSENSDADMFDPDRVPQRETSTVSLSSKELTVAPETVKKRRGRPRKNVGSTGGGGGIESDHSKVVNDKNLKKVTDTMEIERRTSESDTERSYTGRRRKPNKKYLESDIYVQDVDQRVFRTDESQSESDDRTPERVKGRSKRGRKSSGVDKRKTEPLQHIDEKELEITHMLDVLDKTSAVSKADASRDSYESSANKDKSLIHEEVKLTDNQTSVHVMEVLTDSVDEGNLSKDISTYSCSEEPKVPLEDNSLKPQDDTLQLSNEDDNAQHQKPSEQEKLSEESKDQRIESMETKELKHSSEKEELSQTMETMKHVIDMLPPKKSQIKKFELSQIDFFEGDSSMKKSTAESDTTTAVVKSKDLKLDMSKDGSITEVEDKPQLEKMNVVPTVKEINVEATEEKAIKQSEETFPEKKEEISVKEETSEKLQLESSTSEGPIKDTSKTSVEKQVVKSPSMQTRYKGKVIPETGASGKKEVLEEKAVNTFQEAFLKTLHMDKKKGLTGDSESTTWKGKRTKKTTKRKLEEQDSTNSSSTTLIHISKAGEVLGQIESSGNASNVHVTEGNAQISGTSILEANKTIKIEQKIQEGKIEEGKSSLAEFESKSLIRSPSVEDSAKSITLDMQKIDESSRMSTSTPSPSSDATVPVKKREMPRIIENVTLTEPMQILKSKLLDKIPQKGVKHKLDSDVVKKSDHKGSSKAKVMKIESLPSNSKSKSGQKIASPHISLSKKIQVLKAGDAEATMLDVQSEQRNIHTAQSATPTSVPDKYIQQSSQSLAEMELDINSMPFVLSDDVLTPESIEQMPVVISSIIASSSTIPATLSFTTTTQAGSASATQLKLTESSGEVSPSKKKSGTPAILKTKNKAKPTITSIKTLVPPLTGGVKGIKFQNTQAAKTPPLLAQKSTPGKYVVVQTSGGPQVRYSVQGKPGTQQKIAIPAGKSAANAQVVQQGGKVVILTSAQSGQTKMLPLNISKTLGGKVQRIVTNKGQVLCPVSPQGIVASKTILASKGDGTSPTTSKLASGHKIINTQGIITSKSVLTSLSGTIGKTTLLGTLSQGILTKGGICMPINASALGGKTIIGSKALVTKGATLLSSQNLGTSKAILTTISPTIAGKTILSTQGIMGTKGTIVTPITGQQVKAIAAKSPGKGSKVQYQSVQQKVQLPMLQKAQKVSVSPSTQMRPGQLKPATSTLVLQNTSPSQKTLLPGKKVVKQVIVQQGTTLQNIAAQGAPQQSMGIVQQMQQKGKGASGSAVQKVIIPRGAGRQTKSQQKLMVQKVQEPSISTVHNVQQKQSHRTSSTNLTASKSAQQKSSAGISTPTKSGKAHGTSKAAQQQKNLLQVAMSTGTTTNVSTTITTPLSLPPLETIEPEKKHKVENVITEIVKDQSKIEKVNLEKSTETEKVEEPKVTAQPQIMALPTESSDGTQTYVLVTIDEQGQIQPLDNNTLMSLEGTTQNPDGTRTLYIDPSSLGDAGTIDNIVLQFDNGVLPNIQTSGTESTQAIVSERFPTSEVIQTSNQDILAAALANTDFQQEINLSETSAANVMNPGLTQTSLINQTILQSTIIPPTEPISSPSVLETSLTLNQPIMTPLEVPSNLPIQSETTSTSGVPTIPSSLELPITITNPNISYISAGEAQIQIPGNSMPDIGGIIESASTVESGPAENSAGTQYLVIPNLDENMSVEGQNVETTSIPMPSVSYSVSIPNDIVIESQQVQTTPSMPIIDDTYTENIPFSTTMKSSIPMDQQSFVDVPVSEMLVTKTTAATENLQTPDVTVTSEIAATTDAVVSSQETIVSTNETKVSQQEQDVYSSQEVPISSEELILQQTVAKEDSSSNVVVATEGADVSNNENTVSMPIAEQTSESMTSSMPIIDETSLVTSDSNAKMSSVEHISFEVTDSSGIETDDSQESKAADKFKQLSFTEQSAEKVHSPVAEEQAATSNEADMVEKEPEVLPTKSQNELDEEKVTTETDGESQLCVASTVKQADECQGDEPSSQTESALEQRNLELHFDEISEETSHETPSQSYDKFGISVTSGSADLPSQSASKSENSREPSQSVSYEPMETDEDPTATEPPTQSFEHSKMNEASQSYETSGEASTNAPTQSFNEVMQTQEETSTVEEVVDDQTFPTQSYEVDKPENTSENLETDAEISQEGNIPSQSNDIGADGIGTSSVSTNNSGLNEDETASSSYVPETPENQERDQDQESAISTSSYEIPPCEELNIASSSVIPDTSVRAEHTSIHDNGVPEIPTSSYNLNPDITSTHVDSVPTSSYEDQVIVEQNVSTSYEVPISMPGLEETCSQNFVTESTDHRNEPSSYYGHHQEVTASYYETVDQETNSRLEGDAQEEATPSYYEGNPQEASQSYFNPEEASQSYSGGHNVSASYYDPRPEGEASQSYYSTDDIEKTEQSSSQNIEASQSFYQEQSDEMKLQQQGEATPTYSESYPVDYTLDNSPIERHDLVESSVPATRPTER